MQSVATARTVINSENRNCKRRLLLNCDTCLLVATADWQHDASHLTSLAAAAAAAAARLELTSPVALSTAPSLTPRQLLPPPDKPHHYHTFSCNERL